MDHRRTFRGYALTDALPVLQKIAAHDFDQWTWCRNTRCKYLRIGIDTRDGGWVSLFDRDGKDITLDELEYQLRTEKP